MKKYLFYSFIVATSAMTLASCSSDELEATKSGDQAVVAFNVQTPNSIGSRSYADGLTATNLKYAVYDAQGNHLQAMDGTATMSGLKATVTLNLVTDNKYKVVFWAESPSSPYTIDWDSKTMTYKAGETIKAQDENRDAFYKAEEIEVKGNSEQSVILTRPFAQLNIGTDDIAAAKKSGVDVTETQITVTGVPNTLNLLDGTTSGSEDVTYTYAAIPTGETFPVSHADASKSYDYLSMNYILMSADKATTDVTFKFKASEEHERTYASVPVQRNYRTNIYGSLLTNTADFNVEINPDFETPDYSIEKFNVSTNEELTEALKSDKERIIVNLTSDLTVNLAAWKDLSFGGANTKDIYIQGATGEEKITFNGTNSDWNSVTLANDDAVLNISNIAITNNKTGGTWNADDINFDCKVNLRNVTSDRPIALHADATLENTTIAVNGSAEAYGLWITAQGATVSLKNCTLDMTAHSGDRCIKIADQYYSSPELVTLNVSGTTFKSSKKAAVLVTSKAGADITWGEGNDISGVAKDAQNAVWVDNGSGYGDAVSDFVTVSGCTKIVEP